MLFRDICVLVDVECTIGQSRCTAEIKTICFRIDDARIGTGYRRCNAIGMSVEAGSHTAHTRGAIILFIAVIFAIKVCKLWQCCFINSIVFDVMVLIIQRSIKDT